MTNVDDPLPNLMRNLRSPTASVRAKSARALGRLGWLARDAIPMLAEALHDTDSTVRESAAQAIGQMGPDALPHLVKMLNHTDKYVRRNAVWSLGKLGSLAKNALTNLCTTLRDPDPRTASGAAQALGNMGSDAAAAIPSLTEAMRGTNIVLCRLAAKALSQVGRSALPALIAHLRHRDPFVRGEAALALGWLGAAAAPAVPTLIDTARPILSMAPTPSVSAHHAQTPCTPIAIPNSVTPSDETSRVCAIQALGRIGSAAADAIPMLRHCRAERSEAVRQAAEHAIQLISAASAE